MSQQQQLMDQGLDIKEYFSNLRAFTTSFITNFYVDFSKNRLLTGKGTPEWDSSR